MADQSQPVTEQEESKAVPSSTAAAPASSLLKPVKNWADDEDVDESQGEKSEPSEATPVVPEVVETEATKSAKEEELVNKFNSLSTSAANSADINLLTGDLMIRLSGSEKFIALTENETQQGIENIEDRKKLDGLKVNSFVNLNINEKIKKAIIKNKGWENMSKIQQVRT